MGHTRACIVICAMAAAAGRCVPPLPSIPEAVAEDLIITAAIKTALLNDHEVKGARIDVETVRGIVTLSGVVPTEMGGRRAIELAGAVNGVVDVKSRLRIERSPTEPVEIEPRNVHVDARCMLWMLHSRRRGRNISSF